MAYKISKLDFAIPSNIGSRNTKMIAKQMKALRRVARQVKNSGEIVADPFTMKKLDRCVFRS